MTWRCADLPSEAGAAGTRERSEVGADDTRGVITTRRTVTWSLLTLTVRPDVHLRADTLVAVIPVHAVASVLTRCRHALVYILLAVHA